MKYLTPILALLLLTRPIQAQTVADILAAVKALDDKVTVKLANLEARVKALEGAGAAPRMAVNHVHHYYPAGVVAPKVVPPKPTAPAVPPKVLPKVSRLPAPGRALRSTAMFRPAVAPPLGREAQVRQIVRQEWARAAPVGRCPSGG